MDKELEQSIEMTKKNLAGMKDFCDEISSRFDLEDSTDEKKRHLVFFCNAMNDLLSVLLKYNNSLTGKVE